MIMKEISLNILDIAQNSIAADADTVMIEVSEDTLGDKMTVIITDNGKGMSEEMLSAVTDPFTTGRTTRRVGLGIPLLKHAAELTGGSFDIKSKLGEGTTVTAVFGLSHIDRQPLGDIASTMHQLAVMNENTDFIYVHSIDEKVFRFDTKEIKKILGGVSLNAPEVSLWLLEYLKENEEAIADTVERKGN